MKTFLKINVSLHIEDESTPSLDQFKTYQKNTQDLDNALSEETMRRRHLCYPVALQIAGERDVTSREDAESLAKMIQESVNASLARLGVVLTPERTQEVLHETVTPTDAETYERSAQKAENIELRPDYVAPPALKCPRCDRSTNKVVDGDTICAHCNMTLIPKAQASPLKPN